MTSREQEGLWDASFAEGGANLREAQNQVNHLLWEITAGKHDECEVWAATDNAVWLAVWTKGMSHARHLFHLVLTLNRLTAIRVLARSKNSRPVGFLL